MDRRCWRYRKGEARIFASPDDVPEGEGWVDSPALVSESEAKTPKPKRGRPKKAADTEPVSDDDDNA